MGSAEHSVTVAKDHSPDEHEVVSFGADVLLVTSLLIALVVPFFYTLEFGTHPRLIAFYILAVALACVLAPAVTWWLRWGRPGRSDVGRMLLSTGLHVAAASAAAIIIVMVGWEMALLGIGVMSYIAAVVLAIVSSRFGMSRSLPRMAIVRIVCAAGTPLVVLGFANAQPHGFDAIGWWSIPMLIAAAGAIGGARGLQRLTAGV